MGSAWPSDACERDLVVKVMVRLPQLQAQLIMQTIIAGNNDTSHNCQQETQCIVNNLQRGLQLTTLSSLRMV
jgi:hypothetical protein